MCALRLLLIVQLLIAVLVAAHLDTKKLDSILQQGVVGGVYPGAVASAGDVNKVLYQKAVGTHKYVADIASGQETDNSPMSLDTWFDLASVSKVLATTSAVALLYQEGYVALDTPIVDLLPSSTEIQIESGQDEVRSFGSNGKSGVTVRHCLLHNSGLAPDPQPWWVWCSLCCVCWSPRLWF